MDSITKLTAEPNSFHQAQNADEFKARFQGQLNNPDYMARNSNPLGSGVDVGEIAQSQGRHIKMRNDMLHRLGSNPRWKERYRVWVGDSAYDGEILFHIDKQTDPTRIDSFIQFEKPREFGLHAGTTRASEGVLGFGGVPGMTQAGEELSRKIDELANFLQIPERQLHAVIGREIDAHFVKKFQEGQAFTPVNTEEWQAIIDSMQNDTIFQGRELTSALGILRSLKEFPVPSSTPMVFRGKNGLLLVDHGGFRTDAVADQLRMIFPEDTDLIDAARAAPKEQAQRNLQKFIESKGYDHIVYHNSVEDKGSLSIINWNPELQKSIYDPDFAGVNSIGQARASAAGFAALMGVGGANIRDEE